MSDNKLILDRDTYIELTQQERSFLLEEGENFEEVNTAYEEGVSLRTPEFEVVESSWEGGKYQESVYKRQIIRYNRNREFYEMNFRLPKTGKVEVIDKGNNVGKTRNTSFELKRVQIFEVGALEFK